MSRASIKNSPDDKTIGKQLEYHPVSKGYIPKSL